MTISANALLKRRIELEKELEAIERELEGAALLEEIWLELGPYTNALSCALRYKLQDHFGFDDSE